MSYCVYAFIKNWTSNVERSTSNVELRFGWSRGRRSKLDACLPKPWQRLVQRSMFILLPLRRSLNV